MQTITEEKIITSIEPCNADFGHAFDDSIGSLSCVYCTLTTAIDRLPPLPHKLRTGFSAAFSPTSQIQSTPGFVNCISASFIIFSSGTDGPCLFPRCNLRIGAGASQIFPSLLQGHEVWALAIQCYVVENCAAQLPHPPTLHTAAKVNCPEIFPLPHVLAKLGQHLLQLLQPRIFFCLSVPINPILTYSCKTSSLISTFRKPFLIAPLVHDPSPFPIHLL